MSAEGDRPVEAAVPAQRWKAPRSRVNPEREKEVLEHVRNWRMNAALTLLMQTYGGTITTFIAYLVYDHGAIEEIRQDVFHQVTRGIKAFEGRNNATVLTWLCSIARNRCMDELRRARRRAAVSLDDLDGLARHLVWSGSQLDSERVVAQRALMGYLAELSPVLRDRVIMRFYLGLSDAEIADIVGATPGAVQVSISRALLKLRERMSAEGNAS